MKKLAVILLIAISVYACTQAIKNGSGQKPYNTLCYNGKDVFCSQLPDSIPEAFNDGYGTVLNDTIQPPFDVFSWQTFIAINWPADASGNPKGGSLDSYSTAPRVWEHYTDPALIFNDANSTLFLHLKGARDAGEKLLYMASKSPHRLNGGPFNKNDFQEADGFPLVDKNMNFAVYEIKLNKVEDTFITNNHLTTIAGIYKYAPKGLSMPGATSLSQPGTIEVKAAWRILDPSKGDDTTRYYCRKAIIYMDAKHTTNKKELFVTATVGLVGMHIIRNTPGFATYLLWSSFEHVDNAPDSAQLQENKVWSFYNPSCKTCKVNTPFNTVPSDSGKYLWSPEPPYAQYYKDSLPARCSQVTRVNNVYAPTDTINGFWRAQLKSKGSVWANYRLIGTQWKRNGDFPGGSSVAPAPPILANTTMETYLQPVANCIGCHGGANVIFTGTNPPDTISTALSWVIAFGAH